MSTSASVQIGSNATKHNGTSKKLFVPGEDPAAFQMLLSGLMAEYRPNTVQSQAFVENVAEAHWLLARRQRAHNRIETAIYTEQPDPANWTGEHLKKIALADRYKTQAERALRRALNNLEGWRKWVRGEDDRERRRSQWEAQQNVRERRMTLQEQKFTLASNRSALTAAHSAKNAVYSPSDSDSNSNAADHSVEIIFEKPIGAVPALPELRKQTDRRK